MDIIERQIPIVLEGSIIDAFDNADIKDTIWMKDETNTTLYEEVLQRFNDWYINKLRIQ